MSTLPGQDIDDQDDYIPNELGELIPVTDDMGATGSNLFDEEEEGDETEPQEPPPTSDEHLSAELGFDVNDLFS